MAKKRDLPIKKRELPTKKRELAVDAPLLHALHKKPRTRREFLGQGLIGGGGYLLMNSALSLLSTPAFADLDPSIISDCNITNGAGKIPFICFDLAGGANIAGSNVLIGQAGGQLDFLSTAGYSKLGLPGDMIPSIANPQTANRDFVNTELGLAFHSDSGFLRGILERTSPATRAGINGAVIPARSENDTANNPHNPMYGLYKAGSDGSLLTLIGSSSSDSGGNSMAPTLMMDASVRPVKVDRASDVTGLVDVGDLTSLLSIDDASAVMESIYRLSSNKIARINSGVARDASIKKLLNCSYVKAYHNAKQFGDPSTLNPTLDTRILGSGGIFTQPEFDSDAEFRKTAAVMKMVINGFAGAGTIAMGGFDYHTGERATGELRDLRAGRCMGACLEYAARVGKPLMLYVFSDGSLTSNGRIDDSVNGRGKGEWTGDNSSVAASFFLVYNPGGRPSLLGGTADQQARHQQIGYMRADASIETSATPAANNVNLLVETVLLNYMALHNEHNNFASVFPNHGLGNNTLRDSLMAFAPLG